MDQSQHMAELNNLRARLAEAERGNECGDLNPCKECLWKMIHVAEKVITAAKEVVDATWFEEHRKRGWREAQELKDAVDAAVEYGNRTGSRHPTGGTHV